MALKLYKLETHTSSFNPMNCPECKEDKHINDFEYNKKKRCYRKICKKCRNIQVMKARYATVENHVKRRLSRLKEKSKRMGTDFNLTYDDLYRQLEKQDFKCFYTDTELKFYAYKEIPNKRMAPSIDKIIPEKGYTKGNVVWCIDRINSIKYDCSLDEMKAWMPEWYRRITDEF